MDIPEFLDLVKTKADLNQVELEAVKSSLFEIIDAKIIQRLGEEFNHSQKQSFLNSLKQFNQDHNPQTILKALTQNGFDSDKAQQYLDQATNQAFEEILSLLQTRI